MLIPYVPFKSLICSESVCYKGRYRVIKDGNRCGGQELHLAREDHEKGQQKPILFTALFYIMRSEMI